MIFKAATGLATLLAIFIYRSGRVAWHHILTSPNLPTAYYAGGNWTSHCTLIQDPTSTSLSYCEDITFWDHLDPNGTLTDRLVLLGCDPNRKAWNTVMGPLRDPSPRGHLFLYHPTTHAVQRLTLTNYPAHHDFHPLGMDVYPATATSDATLFVVNHARAETTVEQFTLDPARPTEARHVRTLRSPYFVSPNAIAVTGPASFYVSNDHLMTRRLPDPVGRVLPIVETIAGLPLGWVAHVALHADTDTNNAHNDKKEEEEEEQVTLTHTFAALGIPFANGLARSPVYPHLAVASTSLGRVDVYAVDPTTPALAQRVYSVPVPFFPDNVAYDDEGVLIVTGHPYFPALVEVAANKTGGRAPSWAVEVVPRIEHGDGDVGAYDVRAPLSASRFAPHIATHKVETLFQSDGTVFGSSSTTLRDARTGTIYVAGLYEEGMLVCRP